MSQVQENKSQVITGQQSQTVQDNITKAKMLMISLNEALNNLFQAAFRANVEQKTPESQMNFEKCFEEFYSIIDLIEINLVTSLKCVQQAENSSKYLPYHITSTPSQPNSLSYDKYLERVASHINFTKSIKDGFTLTE